jgi:hypothetical protein
MGSRFSYSKAAMERAMKVQEVILRTMAKKITWLAGRRKNGGATGCGKDAGWKSQRTDFPTPLGNPANPAGFPLSHSLGDCGRLTKTGYFICYEKGTFLMS